MAAPTAGAAADASRFVARSDLLSFRSPTGIRWRVGGQVERSTTEGETWEVVLLPAPAVIVSGHAPVGNVVWLVGRAGAVFVTGDGEHFDAVPFVDATDLMSVIGVNERDATVTTVDGRRFRTGDRGRTWTQL